MGDGKDLVDKVFLEPYQSGNSELLIITRRVSAAFAVEVSVKLLGKKRFGILSRNGKIAPGFPIKIIAGSDPACTADIIQLYGLIELVSRHKNLFSLRMLPTKQIPEQGIYCWKMFGNAVRCWVGNIPFRREEFTMGTGELREIPLDIFADGFLSIEKAGTYVDRPVVSLPIGFLSDQSEKLAVSWLNKYRTVSLRSGPNWGKRFEHKRRENEAYIPVPREKAKTKFFPPRGVYFTVVTNDGDVFIMAAEQDNNKAVTTAVDNSILGRYIRRVLDLPSGTEVKLLHFQKYGRSDVLFSKIDDETYYMDFSRPT